MRGLSRMVFRLQGWKIEGQFPEDKKFIVIGAPHTSNWDAMYMIGTGFLLKSEFRWLVKDSVIDSPVGRLALWGGAMPIDRSHKDKQVEGIVQRIEQMDEVILIISPEGSRSKVKRWKTGFYHIAIGANLPVVPCFLDYPSKVIGIGPAVHLTGDLEKDMTSLGELYNPQWAKYPDQFTMPCGNQPPEPETHHTEK